MKDRWAKSSRSESGNCAEVRAAGGMVLVRDSKDKTGPVLAFTPAEWAAFTAAVKADDSVLGHALRRAAAGDPADPAAGHDSTI
jgi:hypothetical protein